MTRAAMILSSRNHPTMGLRLLLASAVFILLLTGPFTGRARACTSFIQEPPEGPVFGTNLDLLDDALTILDHVGVQSAHWVGHSMGGFVAQLAAIHHSERVLSLTSVSSHAAHPDLPSPSEETWKAMLANQPRGDIRRDLPGFMTVWRYLNGRVPFDEGVAEAYTRELYRRNPKLLQLTVEIPTPTVAESRKRMCSIRPSSMETPCTRWSTNYRSSPG